MQSKNSTLMQMPSTKTQVEVYTDGLRDEILSGNADPLQVAIQLKAMEDVIKNLRKDSKINDLILEEAEKHGKTSNVFGAQFQIKETGVKYDFSECGDVIHDELSKQLTTVKDALKKRETTLKAHSDSWVSESTGEVINPPLKTSTTKVTVTLK